MTVLVTGLLALSSGTASAHTGLETAEPHDGEVLAASPDELTLTYTKPVELLGRSVVLTGPEGRRSELERTELSDDQLAVTAVPAAPLAAGEWQLDWKVLAADSHPREGTVTFVVEGPAPEQDGAGDPTATPSVSPPTESPTGQRNLAGSVGLPLVTRGIFEAAAAGARVVFYLGMMVAVGLALFKAGPHRGEASRAGRLAHIAAVAAAVALAASALEVVAHVGALTDDGLAGTVDAGTWRAVLRTGLGTAFAARSLGLILLLIGGFRRWRRALPSGPDALKLAGAALAIASFQFVGHTASAAPAWVVRSADAVHAVAAAVWIGGLVGLAIIARRKGDRAAGMRTAGRFSSVASVSVAAVALAGVALSWVNLPDLEAVYTTGYGRLLVAKLTLVAALAAIGAHNHFKVVPRLEQGDVTALRQLKRAVRVEVVLVVAVVALTALLVNASPS